MAGSDSTMRRRRLRDVLPLRGRAPDANADLGAAAARYAEAIGKDLRSLLPDARCVVVRTGSGRELLTDAAIELAASADVNDDSGIAVVATTRKGLFTLMNAALGGAADASTGRADRKLATLDRRLLHMLASSVLASISTAAAGSHASMAFSQLELHLDRASLEPLLVGEETLGVELTLTSGDVSVPIFLALGADLVRAPDTVAGARDETGGMSGLSRTQVHVSVDAVLEAHALSLGELRSLRVGDMLALVGEQAARVTLQSGGVALFTATAGQRGGDLFARIETAVAEPAQAALPATTMTNSGQST